MKHLRAIHITVYFQSNRSALRQRAQLVSHSLLHDILFPTKWEIALRAAVSDCYRTKSTVLESHCSTSTGRRVFFLYLGMR